MKKVLIITYYWPPSGGPGVQRWLKFTKYLPGEGIEPIVVTVDPNFAEYPVTDHSLLKEVNSKLQVLRTKTWEPFNFYKKISGKKNVNYGSVAKGKGLKNKLFTWIRANLFVPDARKYWKKYAVKEALKQIDQHKIDTIITTGPPHSTHLIGLELKTSLSHLKWIADFRDPWSNFMFNESLPKTSWAKNIELAMEQKVLKKADLILCATEGIKKDFEQNVSNLEVILNGYDQDDLPKRTLTKNDKFTLTYIGNFRSNQNISEFWNAMQNLEQLKLLDKSNFSLQLIGNVDASVKQSIMDFGIEHLCEFKGYMDHNLAMKYMMNADMLLLIIPDVASKMSINTGKIFEYMASEVPILAIGPKRGNADIILKSCELDGMIEYADIEKIKGFIRRTMKDSNSKASAKKFEMYSRRNLTKKLVEAINKIGS